MKTVAALVWSEWHARRWWLVILGVVGIAVALAMSVPLWAEASVDQIGAAVWLSLAAVVLLVTPFAVGFSMNYRDIAENRLGFYLTKPPRGFSLWVARYAAGLGLVLIAGVLPLLPTVAVLKNADLAAVEPEVLVLVITSLLFLTALLFYSAGFCLGIGVATGSQWRALDVVAACVLLAGLWWLANLLDSAGAHANARLGLVLFSFLTLPALTSAGAVAISRGRMEANRIHRGLTFTLWPLMALSLLAFQPYSQWVFSPEMEDLVDPEVGGSGTDSWWVEISGEAYWRPGVEWIFLYNVKTDRAVRVPLGQFELSRDGSIAVWKEASNQSLQLVSLLLDNANAEPVFGPLVGQGHITISPDGSRCAVVGDGQVTVYSLPGFRELFNGPRPVADSAPYDILFFFVSRDLLRIYAEGTRTWTIWEVDVAAQSSHQVGTMPARGFSSAMRLSPDGQRVVLWNTSSSVEGPTVELRDGRSGGLLQPLTPVSDSGAGGFRFLSDGRLVGAVGDADPSLVGLVSADGQMHSVTTFAGRQIWTTREVASGRLLVATRPPDTKVDDVLDTRLEVVDLVSGNSEEVGRSLEPLVSGSWSGIFFPPTPGSPATKLFTDPAGNLVFFDPLIGKRETLLELENKVRKE